MFDYSLLHWTTFLATAVLLNLSPGPDIAFILGQTIKGGRSAGFSAMLGIWSGTFVHVFMAALGLSAIIASSAIAFSVVKWVGVLYLIWLGINALKSEGSGLVQHDTSSRNNKKSIFKQGLFVSILNPKVAIFFLAFLPQFVVDGAGPLWMQLVLHGILVVVVAAVIEPPLIMIGARLGKALEKPEIGKWLDRCLGTLFIALGVRLAFSEAP